MRYNTMYCSSMEFTEEELFIDKKARGPWVRTYDVKVIWAMPKSKHFLSESLPKLQDRKDRSVEYYVNVIRMS